MNATKTREGNQSVCPGVLGNGQTVAIIGTTLTVAVGIAAMILASTSAIRVELRTEIRRVDTNMAEMRKELSAEIKGVREELSAEIKGVREELSAEIDGVRAEVKGLDGRLRVVEQTVAAVNARLTPGVGALPNPPAHGVAPASGG